MSEKEAIEKLEEIGATKEKKEDRTGKTRSGWWMDDVFLAPINMPKLAIESIYG